MSMGNPEDGLRLPDDIVIEILLRLSVKSLVRLSCVCKSWRNLITSNEVFISTHMKRGIANRRVELLMFSNVTMGKNEKDHQKYDVQAAYDQAMNSMISTKMPVSIDLGRDLLVAGCCDGLICFHSPEARSVYLWNPALHQCRSVSTKDEYADFVHGFDFVGFGYDSKNRDYKVVKLSLGTRGGADVFSLKRNSWKSISNSFCSRPSDACGLNVLHLSLSFNGCMHWIATHKLNDTVHRSSILAFDFVDEKLNLFKLPSAIPANTAIDFACLGVMNGSVSLITGDGSRWDVWSMKTYGMPDSWMKTAVIDEGPGPCRPLGVSADGKILLRKGSKTVFAYDPESSRCSRLYDFIEERPVGDCYFVANYVESLISVSPKTGWLRKIKFYIVILKPLFVLFAPCLIPVMFVILVIMYNLK